MEGPKVTRRRFVDWLLGASLLAWLGSIAYPMLRYLRPLEAGGQGGPTILTADDLAKLETEKMVIVRAGPARVLVFKDQAGEVRALDAKCTHEGCTVSWLANESQIGCACHNARFDIDGRVLSGPPPRPLATHDIQRGEDDSLQVIVKSA